MVSNAPNYMIPYLNVFETNVFIDFGASAELHRRWYDDQGKEQRRIIGIVDSKDIPKLRDWDIDVICDTGGRYRLKGQRRKDGLVKKLQPHPSSPLPLTLDDIDYEVLFPEMEVAYLEQLILGVSPHKVEHVVNDLDYTRQGMRT